MVEESRASTSRFAPSSDGVVGREAHSSFPPCPHLPTTPSLSASSEKTRTYISALGLDVGSKRIGVAGCDRTGLIAAGLTTVERKSFEYDVAQFQRIVQDRQVNVLVVGLPYSMNGSLGFQAKQVQKFAERLAKALQLPVEYVDERLTSFEAEQLIKAARRSPSRNKGLIDQKAASLILQQWLDERRLRQRSKV